MFTGSLDASVAGKLGARAMLYYVCTTVIAVTEGFVFVYAIRPGHSTRLGHTTNTTAPSGDVSGLVVFVGYIQ